MYDEVYLKSHKPTTILLSTFDEYAKKNELFDEKLWTFDRKLSYFPFKLPEMNIIKSGFMYRPGFLCKWQKAYFVLTETGWLHCFDGSFPKNTEEFEIKEGSDFESFHNFDTKLSLHYR